MDNDNTAPTRRGGIRAVLNAKPDKKDIPAVLALYISGVVIHYLIGSFPKRITVLADELLYYSIAQSIHNGTGVLCLNAHTEFNKVLYSLVLSPFFGIGDPVLRVKMITLFNSALIMSSVILVFLIGRELGLNRANTYLSLLITLMFPDMMYSISFMSENLSLPVTLLSVLVWFRIGSGGRVRRTLCSAALGCLCYAGYLCKNVFLAFVVSFALFEAAYPLFIYLVYRGERPRKRLREYYSGDRLICCGIVLVVFAVCYAAGSVLLYGGSDGNAAGAFSAGLRIFRDPYALLYTLYAFAYLFAASLIAVLALPIAYPAAGFKRLSRSAQSAFSFLTLYLAVSCATIAYTVSLREDIGTTLPRVHLRYLGAVLLLLIVVFFKVLQDKAESDKPVRGQCVRSIFAALLACLVFKGTHYNTVDQSMLDIYLIITELLPPLDHVKGDLVLYPASVAVFVVLAAIIFIVDHFASAEIAGGNDAARETTAGSPKKIGSGFAPCVFAAFMLAVCFQNNKMELSEYKLDYTADEQMISGIVTVNRYLDEAEGTKRILYIPGDNRSDCSKTLITYLDHTSGICHSNTEDVLLMTDADGVIDVPNTAFKTTFFSFFYTYDRISGFDYIITDSETGLELNGVTPIAEASGEYYTLYGNDDPATVEAVLKA